MRIYLKTLINLLNSLIEMSTNRKYVFVKKIFMGIAKASKNDIILMKLLVQNRMNGFR